MTWMNLMLSMWLLMSGFQENDAFLHPLFVRVISALIGFRRKTMICQRTMCPYLIDGRLALSFYP